MKLLLVILSAIMSWIVNSKTSVTGEGFPTGVSATYACTYQKGDVRSGDTATLTLTHMANMTVEQIEVYVKSNKSSGAGVFTVEVNDQPVATKSGSFKEWCGSYDNSDYHAVALLTKPVNDVNEMTIRLVGTENSLHIQKYAIHYTAAAPHSVTLMCGNTVYRTLTETSGGAGVNLPALPAVTSWESTGWSSMDFGSTDQLPDLPLYTPGTKFIPTEDCTLWAVYSQDRTPGASYATELISGEYIYVNAETHKTMCGVPTDGKMEFCYEDLNDTQMYYLFDFYGSDTVYITHAATQTPIGYNAQAQLVADVSPWRVYHDGEQTLLYAVISGKTYVLWVTFMEESGAIEYVGLLETNLGSSPMRLLSTLVPQRQITYTCHPETQAIEPVNETTQNIRTIMRFGNYELRLHNGQKELIAW